jgi:Zn finger protein HypA/HybF involved in hydrogenase expression
MATLIKPDGATSQVLPANGEAFTLEELQAFVGGYIEMILVGSLLYLFNEEGKLLDLPVNTAATHRAHDFLFEGDYLVWRGADLRTQRVGSMRLCEVCGGPAPASERCTNGRCAKCHAKHCTGGGITEPGHGRGTVLTYKGFPVGIRCPKCKATSGNDWSQCGTDCPMPMSPAYAKPAP